MEYSNLELLDVLRMFEKGRLNIQDNPVAIEKMGLLKHLDKMGYVRLFPVEENNLPPVALLTEKGERVLQIGSF